MENVCLLVNDRCQNASSTIGTADRVHVQHYYHLRIFKSRHAFAALSWCFLISIALDYTSYSADLFSKWATSGNDAYSDLFYSGILALTLVSCPVFGYLADVHFGRYKMLTVFSITLTAGMLIGEVYLILSLSGVIKGDNSDLAVPLISLSTFVITSISSTVAKPSLLVFGIDQLKDACSDELSSFVLWWTWVEMLTKAINDAIVMLAAHVGGEDLVEKVLVPLYFSMAVGLWLFLFFNHRCLFPSYHMEPRSGGSYKQAFQVLKFAITHKYPLNRSAWTYCEDERISRIDLGKSRYGGPFSTEQVEDVKVTLWILVIIAVSCVASLPLAPSSDSYIITAFQNRMRWTGGAVRNIVFAITGVFVIPVHEFVIFPLLRRWYPSILKRHGFTIILFVISALGLLVIDNWPAAQNHNVCMFQAINTTQQEAPAITAYSMMPSNILYSVAYSLYFSTLMELTIAQSPEYFKSILVGLTYALFGLRFMLLQTISLPFMWVYMSRTSQSYENFNCASIFFIVIIAIGTIGLVLYCLFSNKYVYRRRDDVTINEHMYAEEYYSQDTSSTNS